MKDGNPIVVAAVAVCVACLMYGEMNTQPDIVVASGASAVGARETADVIYRPSGVVGLQKSKRRGA